jgi:8-oxo-dGTP pyrophosphatase MutT (NUDIX family)
MSNIENPWKKISSTQIYKNDWLTLREDQVVRPDGEPGIYSVVETRIATGVVALTEGGDVYLVGQYRYPLDCYSWEIPEGGTHDGESPIAAAQRELREEAGLEADHWLQLGGELHLSNCFSSERGYLYLARGLREVASSPEPTEILQVKRLPFAEALAMVKEGEIKDTISIIALLMVESLGYAQRS